MAAGSAFALQGTKCHRALRHQQTLQNNNLGGDFRKELARRASPENFACRTILVVASDAARTNNARALLLTGDNLTEKRTGEPWMPAEEYGRGLPQFTVNLIVRDVARSVEFYTNVLGAAVRYADPDFAALQLGSIEFMLHADHAYDQHPLASRLATGGPRGTGAELRLLGVDPDALAARARVHGTPILQPVSDKPHGWREVMLADPDGYVWAVGVASVK